MLHVSRSARITAGAALVALLAITLQAQSPHFIRVTATLDPDSGALTVSFKEAGLGDNQLITYEASADATATYHCVNVGGQCPNAANKRDLQGPATATGAFLSGKNGQVTASLTIDPLPVVHQHQDYGPHE